MIGATGSEPSRYPAQLPNCTLWFVIVVPGGRGSAFGGPAMCVPNRSLHDWRCGFVGCGVGVAVCGLATAVELFGLGEWDDPFELVELFAPADAVELADAVEPVEPDEHAASMPHSAAIAPIATAWPRHLGGRFKEGETSMGPTLPADACQDVRWRTLCDFGRGTVKRYSAAASSGVM